MVLPGHAPAGFAALRVSTDTMPPRHRLAMWREEFARQFLQLNIEPHDPEHFCADTAIRMLPGLKISSFTVSFGRDRNGLMM